MRSATPTLDDFRMLAKGYRDATTANVVFHAVMKPELLRALSRELSIGTSDRRAADQVAAAAEREGPTGLTLEGTPIVCSSSAVGISMRPGAPR